MPFQPDNPRELGYYFGLAQAGFEMVAPIGLGVALDRYLGWAPWGATGGAVLGLVIGLTHLVVMTNKRQEDDNRKGSDREGPLPPRT